MLKEMPNLSKQTLKTLTQAGWAAVAWNEESTLRDLATCLFSSSSISDDYRVRSTKRLPASPKSMAPLGTKSKLRGLAEFPAHTDEAFRTIPPRYVLLRSRRGKSDSATFFLRPSAGQLDNCLLSDLTYGLWASRGGGSSHLTHVWSSERIKWDEDCMRPLDFAAKRAHDEFRKFLSCAAKQRHVWSNRSTVILVDNWKTLHGREPVHVNERRELERTYVEVE